MIHNLDTKPSEWEHWLSVSKRKRISDADSKKLDLTNTHSPNHSRSATRVRKPDTLPLVASTGEPVTAIWLRDKGNNSVRGLSVRVRSTGAAYLLRYVGPDGKPTMWTVGPVISGRH